MDWLTRLYDRIVVPLLGILLGTALAAWLLSSVLIGVLKLVRWKTSGLRFEYWTRKVESVTSWQRRAFRFFLSVLVGLPIGFYILYMTIMSWIFNWILPIHFEPSEVEGQEERRHPTFGQIWHERRIHWETLVPTLSPSREYATRRKPGRYCGCCWDSILRCSYWRPGTACMTSGASKAKRVWRPQAVVLVVALSRDLLMSGKEFTNPDNHGFSRDVRVLLYVGYIMLVCTCVLYFSSQTLGDTNTPSERFFEAERVVQQGIVLLGTPYLLARFLIRFCSALGWPK